MFKDLVMREHTALEEQKEFSVAGEGEGAGGESAGRVGRLWKTLCHG